MPERPLILVSNDDGVAAAGIAALAAALADLGEVLVVAPDRERSATGHAISLDTPLRVDELRAGWQAVSGTPVDCVYLAVHHLCPRRPALCVSGINHGYNLGSDVFYSGTVAAAVEAALRGVPALALSLERDAAMDFSHAARFAHAMARAVLAEGMPGGTLLNVNVPRGEIGGYRWTHLGQRSYRDQVDVRQDLRGRRYYWIGGPEEGVTDRPASDGMAVASGVASVTPLGLDLTHHELLGRLPSWRLPGFEAILAQEMPA